jgi:hypothetical protein
MQPAPAVLLNSNKLREISMKKIIALAILVGISFSAQAEKMYAAAGIGTASNFGTAFTIAGGYKIMDIKAGSRLTIPLAAEVGYVNFGSKDYGGGSKVSASGFFGTAVGSYKINNDLAATARLGLATVTAKADVCFTFFTTTCTSASSTSTETVMGVGIRYSLKKQTGMPLFVGAEYNDYGGESIIGGRVALEF